jgi:hypothetical protein
LIKARDDRPSILDRRKIVRFVGGVSGHPDSLEGA